MSPPRPNPHKHHSTLHLHRLQKTTEVKLLLISPLIPQLAQIVQPALLALLFHLPRRHIDHIFFSALALLVQRGSSGGGGCRLAEIEEVEDLVRFHGGQAGVLLVHDGGGDVDFEALEAVRPISRGYLYMK